MGEETFWLVWIIEPDSSRNRGKNRVIEAGSARGFQFTHSRHFRLSRSSTRV